MRRLRKSLEDNSFFVVYFEADEENIDPQNVEYINILLACTRRFLKDIRSVNAAPIQQWLRDRGQELKDLAQMICKIQRFQDEIAKLKVMNANAYDWDEAFV